MSTFHTHEYWRYLRLTPQQRCISSEVYGNTDAGVPNQWVGELTTADVNYENGILLNYTLIDKESYLWLQ